MDLATGEIVARCRLLPAALCRPPSCLDVERSDSSLFMNVESPHLSLPSAVQRLPLRRLYHFPPVWPWASYSTSLVPALLICK